METRRMPSCSHLQSAVRLLHTLTVITLSPLPTLTPPTISLAVDALDFLQLQYKVSQFYTYLEICVSSVCKYCHLYCSLQVEWPCNVVITEDCLRKYNRVRFQFALYSHTCSTGKWKAFQCIAT